MPAETFFPCAGFAWAYCATVTALALLAAGIDLRSYTIPKVYSLGLLAVGLVFSMVRGGWVGASGGEAWVLGHNGAFVGVLDALLFSIAGVLVGFGLFFAMWILGACGGGDVKLFAAAAAWFGPLGTIYLLMVTLFWVIVLSLVKLSWSAGTRGMQATVRDFSAKARRHAGGRRRTASELAQSGDGSVRLLSYSLPIALAAALTLGWVFRKPLQLQPSVSGAAGQTTQAQPTLEKS